jgi:hypothetical protein
MNSVAVRGRVLLVDGFTVTAADTPRNQAEYPQNPAQKEGIGFPILRGVTLISLMTGMLFDCEIGPYSGKESGETALLWKLLSQLRPGDILVADSYYCTYWLVAACLARGVQIVMKNHHKRDDNPPTARRINKHQRTVTWDRPPGPEWISDEVYAEQPATIDIRSIKCSLGMDMIRGKTPEMVRTEFWSCLLAYNLIRAKMLQSCATSGRDPRSLSFTTTMQLLGTNWLLCAVIGVTSELAQLGQEASSSEVVGHRPDRGEPRVNKRRPKVLALMTKPRLKYHAELVNVTPYAVSHSAIRYRHLSNTLLRAIRKRASRRR